MWPQEAPGQAVSRLQRQTPRNEFSVHKGKANATGGRGEESAPAQGSPAETCGFVKSVGGCQEENVTEQTGQREVTTRVGRSRLGRAGNGHRGHQRRGPRSRRADPTRRPRLPGVFGGSCSRQGPDTTCRHRGPRARDTATHRGGGRAQRPARGPAGGPGRRGRERVHVYTRVRACACVNVRARALGTCVSRGRWRVPLRNGEAWKGH